MTKITWNVNNQTLSVNLQISSSLSFDSESAARTYAKILKEAIAETMRTYEQ